MSIKPWVLGISASHNGAYCLLHGDEIVVAIQDERLIRRKRSRVFGARPSLALNYCLQTAGISLNDINMIALSAQGPYRAGEHDLALHPDLQSTLHRIPTVYLPHHLAHGFSAYATSGFTESAVLVVDGVGSPYEDLLDDERKVSRGAGANGWETFSTYLATPKGLHPIDKHLVQNGEWVVKHPGKMWGFRSLGGMFSAVAEQIFGDPMEAGKVMGLAPYGKVETKTEDFFDIANGLIQFSDSVPALFPHIDRWPIHETAYSNLAASTQRALECALLSLTRRLREQSGSTNLCYAGGVALNGIANQRLLREGDFPDLHIIPAAEDSGVAVGAAYFGLFQLTGEIRGCRQLSDSAGCSYSSAHIDSAIHATPAIEVMPSTSMLDTVVDFLCDGKIGGWFQGGSELGPRALGQRSILCDPRRPDAKEVLNRRVKHRESFRPFAPIIMLDQVPNWFDLDNTPVASPFMLRVCDIHPEKQTLIPGVTHVDGTGRLQSVESGSRLYDLLQAFHARTGVPVLVNTSFNVMGEPIVETPEDALWCMLSTGIDFCVLGSRIVVKRGSYSSLLDLVPRLIVSSFVLDVPVIDGLMDLHSIRELTVETRTPWGNAKQTISAQFFQLLQRIDGTATGWQILEKLIASHGENDLIEALVVLKRYRVIAFGPAPSMGM